MVPNSPECFVYPYCQGRGKTGGFPARHNPVIENDKFCILEQPPGWRRRGVSKLELLRFFLGLASRVFFLYNTGMDKNKLASAAITFRPIRDTKEDLEFLYKVYASTRAEEMALTGWNERQIEEFLRMQFSLQHKQYMQNYQNASFDIIFHHQRPVGRLYADRRQNDIRIVDIALLTEFRRQKIGSKIMEELIAEADEKNVTLSLHVEHNNPALGLYQRLGFEKKDDIGVYFLMERPPPASG